MKRTICIFEDENFINFYPLTYLRPVYELKCGIFSLLEKIFIHFKDKNIFVHSRNYLSEVINEKYTLIIKNDFPQNDTLFINGRILINNDLQNKINRLKINEAIFDDNKLVAVLVSQKELSKIKFDEKGLLNFEKLNFKKENVENVLIKFPWELIENNQKEILNDFNLLTKKKINFKNYQYVNFINKKNIFISKSANISPFINFDASEGPIFIDENAKILSHCYIQGPTYIGKNSLIKANTSIYHGTSIGEFCKVGGEIEASIFHSHSNKQHEGFLGHSYLGQWVNLGAGTNNSDLKNNYSKISVLLNGKNIQTNLQFFGALIGDHTKTAINTKINTGSIFGIACNIFGNNFPQKFLHSFTWGGCEKIENYEFEKFIETAKIVTQRRNVLLTENQIKLLKLVYDEIQNEKLNYNV